jgi:hypothetical protein
VDEADVSFAVAEENEILAQESNGLGQVLKGLGKAHRLPEAAEILAARRSRPDVGQLLVFLRHVPAVVPAKGCD